MYKKILLLVPILMVCASICPVECAKGPKVCNLPAEPGPCKAYFPRYFYNKDTGKCEEFIYGGCQGNGNNFVTLEECQRTCESKGPRT